MKSYALQEVLIQLKPGISHRTFILPLLNGVDIYERIRSVIKNGIVFPSCVYVGTHIERPGKVIQRGGSCTIHFGKDPENDYMNPEILTLLQQANIKYNWTDNPYTEIWSKFIFIASYGMVTANFNKTVGDVLLSEKLSRYVKNIIVKIYNIAKKKQIPLLSTIINESYKKGEKFPFETKTSFQRDYEDKDKPDERDLFGGTIIRMGDKLGINTRTTKIIYDSLQKKKVLK